MEYFFFTKKRKREAINEVGEFISDENNDVMVLNMKEYHNNIQSFGLRKAILEVFPELVVLDKINRIIVIKTNVKDILSKPKNKKILKNK